MAKSRKKLFDLLAVAGGTSDFLASKDQDLKILVALHTVIFEDRHLVISSQAYDFLYNIGRYFVFVQSHPQRPDRPIVSTTAAARRGNIISW